MAFARVGVIIIVVVAVVGLIFASTKDFSVFCHFPFVKDSANTLRFVVFICKI